MNYPYPPLLTPSWTDLPTDVRGVLWSLGELIAAETRLHCGLVCPQPTWEERFWVGLQVHVKASGAHLGNVFLFKDEIIWHDPAMDFNKLTRTLNLADPDCFSNLIALLKARHREYRRSLRLRK